MWRNWSPWPKIPYLHFDLPNMTSQPTLCGKNGPEGKKLPISTLTYLTWPLSLHYAAKMVPRERIYTAVSYCYHYCNSCHPCQPPKLIVFFNTDAPIRVNAKGIETSKARNWCSSCLCYGPCHNCSSPKPFFIPFTFIYLQSYGIFSQMYFQKIPTYANQLLIHIVFRINFFLFLLCLQTILCKKVK